MNLTSAVTVLVISVSVVNENVPMGRGTSPLTTDKQPDLIKI